MVFLFSWYMHTGWLFNSFWGEEQLGHGKYRQRYPLFVLSLSLSTFYFKFVHICLCVSSVLLKFLSHNSISIPKSLLLIFLEKPFCWKGKVFAVEATSFFGMWGFLNCPHYFLAYLFLSTTVPWCTCNSLKVSKCVYSVSN